MDRLLISLLAVAVSATLTGCSSTSFSGLAGSKSELSCKAPDGVICTSVSGIYANSLEGNLPALMPRQDGKQDGKGDGKAAEPASSDSPRAFSPRDLSTPSSGDPIRRAPLVLRVWIAPWEDADGDLHDQHYVYTVLNNGGWLIEVNQQAIRDAFRPVFPLGKAGRQDRETQGGDAVRQAPAINVNAEQTGADGSGTDVANRP